MENEKFQELVLRKLGLIDDLYDELKGTKDILRKDSKEIKNVKEIIVRAETRMMMNDGY